jgi:hypothetical protein
MNKSQRDAARQVARARAQLNVARRKLARYSKVGIPAKAVLTGPWERAQKVLDARRQALRAYPGVVGLALGHRHRDGIEHDEICITVFVAEKHSEDELRRSKTKRLPAAVSVKGDRIPIDVIALKPLKPHGADDVIASIGRQANPITAGTIGALGEDLGNNRPVLITAMHVTDEQTFSGPVAMTVPSLVDSAGAPAVGTLTGGTTVEVDAAKIEVNDLSAVTPLLPPGLIQGWRTISDDVNTVVRMYGRTSHGQSGVIKFIDADVFDFKHTLLVKIVSDSGDSGAAILDNANLVLGFLYGLAPADFGDLRVFCPASLVLDKLHCDIKPH